MENISYNWLSWKSTNDKKLQKITNDKNISLQDKKYFVFSDFVQLFSQVPLSIMKSQTRCRYQMKSWKFKHSKQESPYTGPSNATILLKPRYFVAAPAKPCPQ